MRILLHPGFHKTGTSSLQRGAEARVAQLGSQLRLLVTSDVLRAAKAARRYSARPQIEHLRQFAENLAADLDSAKVGECPALLISCEDLSGYIPGNHGVEAYDAAPSLMNVAAATLRARFGEDARLTIWYTTRETHSWQRSVYWQNLRAMRITEDFETYQPTLERAARLNEVVEAVSQRLKGHATVCATAIESCGQTALGPLGQALSLLEISSGGLEPVPAQNIQPLGAAQELLDLNRSDLSDDALSEAKRAVLQRYRQSGQTKRDPA